MKTFDFKIGLLAAVATAMIFCMRYMSEKMEINHGRNTIEAKNSE